MDLAIVIVSANDARWLEPCLASVLARAGNISLEIIVVDNASTDGTREVVESSFPQARVVSSPNRGFAYGNNRGLEHTSARYVLLLNPDTEILQGTLQELIATLDERPEMGLAGVRQIDAHDRLLPTIRRFPNAARALGEALFSERWPLHPAWAGERVLAARDYEREQPCDWTAGSFMLIRREALLSAGVLDERFFLYSEETDLCLRIARAGWGIHHLPLMTIRHHAGKGGVRPALVAQDALSRKLYARKHFSAPHRGLFLGAVGLRHLIRAAGARGLELGSSGAAASSETTARRRSAGLALRTLLGRAEVPFIPTPPTALGPVEKVAECDADSASRREQDALFV
ncbi:MAG TPA: glycosyltransferase family 2 protein [Solirubrobacteraceae bacterium]